MLKNVAMITIILEVTLTVQVCQAQSKSQVSAENPIIVFTYIPPYGSSQDLQGRVYNVNPEDYKVAVYIFVEGGNWWTKPNFVNPLTPIQSDSTWTCDITTGGSDIYATGISAFLLRNGTAPPLADGLIDLPISLDTISVAKVNTARYAKSMLFSGYDWWIKASWGQVGPGNNYFSDSTENVWIDVQGYLHLKITKRNEKWYCPEIICKNSFGYGTYEFYVESKAGVLDKNAVLGLFTFDIASAQYNHEIDIEFSRWGAAEDSNAQYVIQPWTQSENINRWNIPEWIYPSVHSFNWKADSIYFLSVKDDSIIYEWSYKGPNIPSHGNENPRINLWLNTGAPPTDTSSLEAIIKEFKYYIDSTVDVKGDIHTMHTPSTFMLFQNYPNPFNPSTIINYTVPAGTRFIVSIKIFDLLGRVVATLLNESKPAGSYQVEWDAAGFPSGVYFYRLQAGSFTETKKLLLLK